MTDFNTFEDVMNPLLRSYNRATYIMNLIEDHPVGVCKEYLGLFNEAERLAISAILISFKKFGVEETYRAVKQRIKDEASEFFA